MLRVSVVSVLLVLVLAVACLEALSLQDAVMARSRSKRGFRLGAADRFSHGFGKRTQPDNLVEEDQEEPVMTTAEMSDMLRERPMLINSFVRKYLDVDGDGVISRAELFGELRRRK